MELICHEVYTAIIHVRYCLLKTPLRTESTNGIDLPWSLHSHHSCNDVCYCLLKTPLRTESTNGTDLPWSLHSHHSCTLLFTEDPTENWIHKWIWICHEVNTESIDMCHFLLKTQPRTVSTNGYESAMKLTLKALTCAISYWRPNRELYPQMEWLCCKLTLTAVTHATPDWRPSQRWRELNPHMESICSEADTDRISHKNPLSDAGNHNYSTFHQTED